MSDAFRTSSFYGANQKRKRKRIENNLNEIIKKHKSEKIPEKFKASITGPSTNWKTFFRQQDAFTYARSKSSDLHMFAFESETLGSETGQRMYLVASYEVFWHFYRQLSDKQRYHYELIAEGAVCKLYFDLEFLKEKNPEKDGSKLVDIFIKYVCVWLKNHFNISCDRNMVLDLDASTCKKFSRHLIFLIPNIAFKNNIHAGNFVHYVISKLLKKLKNQSDEGETNQESVTDKMEKDDSNIYQKIFSQFDEEELSTLWVKDKNDEETLFCDLGVYTKNRNFRLYLSSKYGKLNPLRLAADNTYQPLPTDHEQYEKQIFMDSLITNVQFTSKLKVLSFDDVEFTKKTGFRRPGSNTTQNTETDTMEGCSKSPYPEIDDFISDLVKENGNNGHIRHWTYFTQGEIILYEISRYRWCENIRRQHRSNNVMLIVNMKKGVYYQKCHDPECRLLNYKSEEHALPRELLPSFVFDVSSDDFEEELDDAEIFNAAVEAEKILKTEENIRQAAQTEAVDSPLQEQDINDSGSVTSNNIGVNIDDSCVTSHSSVVTNDNIGVTNASCGVNSDNGVVNDDKSGGTKGSCGIVINGNSGTADSSGGLIGLDTADLSPEATSGITGGNCVHISVVNELPSNLSSHPLTVIRVSTDQ